MKPRSIHHHREWFEVLETTGRSQVAVMVLAPGQATGEKPEAHASSDQVLLVVEGQVEGEIAGKELTLGSGEFIVIQAGVPHRFVNTSASPVLTFNVYAPPAYPERD